MSTTRGIFETPPSQPPNPQDSPFSVAPESGGAQPTPVSPFTAATRQDSPFSVSDDDAADAKTEGFGKPVKLPERRKVDSPFQMAEPSEGFGFEAPAKPPASESAAGPFSAPPQKAPDSPFAMEPNPAVSPTTQAAIAAFTEWQPPAAPAAASPEPPPVQVPSAFAPAPKPVATPEAQPQQQLQNQDSQSDSFNIRQLELRAIFGVDREMTADEILQRARALPGMRNIARLSSQDMATIEATKNLLPSLGFGSGTLKLYSGSTPLEFIREGSVMLAVQTDGGFAPGVRETLMIVARELAKTS